MKNIILKTTIMLFVLFSFCSSITFAAEPSEEELVTVEEVVDFLMEEEEEESGTCSATASTKYINERSETGCALMCAASVYKSYGMWIPGNGRGNCKCIICRCDTCKKYCVPIITNSDAFGEPNAFCECVAPVPPGTPKIPSPKRCR